MFENETITLSERNRSKLIPIVILAVIGVPHLTIGLASLFAGGFDPTFLITGCVFTLSGTVLLVIAGSMLVGWLNRKVVANEVGLTLTGRLGGTTFVPWDQVSVTDHVSDGRYLEFHVPGRNAKFSRGCKGFEDMRALLRERGLLLDKAGRRKPTTTSGYEVVDVEHLV